MEPQFVIIELLGHRQRAGWLSEEEIAGAKFLRLDIPTEGDPPTRPEWYGVASVYAIHPATEEQVRKLNAPLRLTALPPVTEFRSELDRDDPFWDGDDEEAEAEEDADLERLERHIREHGGVHGEGVS